MWIVTWEYSKMITVLKIESIFVNVLNTLSYVKNVTIYTAVLVRSIFYLNNDIKSGCYNLTQFDIYYIILRQLVSCVFYVLISLLKWLKCSVAVCQQKLKDWLYYTVNKISQHANIFLYEISKASSCNK